MTVLIHKHMTRYTLYIFLSFAGLQATGQGRIQLTSDLFQGPYFKVSLQDKGAVHTQPKNMLYNFHDGGLYEDVSRPQVDFKKETQVMLDLTRWNMEQRIGLLYEKNHELRALIRQHFPEVLANAHKLNLRSTQLNATLLPLTHKPAVVLGVQQQAAMQRYLEQIYNLKDASARELEKVMQKQQLSQNAISDLQKIRTQLLDDAGWHASDGALVLGMLATNMLASSNLVYDLLAINPAVANHAGIYALTRAKEVVQESLVLGEFDLAKMRDAFILASLKDATTEGKDLLKVADAMVNLAQNVKLMTELPEDHAGLKEEIRQQLENIDREIRRYAEKTNKSQHAIELNRYIIQAIDDYLRINNIDGDFRMQRMRNVTPPPQNVRPRGFEFQEIDFRQELYQGIVPLKADIKYERLKMENSYKTVLKRFEDLVTIGRQDPVFPSREALLSSERTAQLCLHYADQVADDLKEIKGRYPAADETLVKSWLSAARESRYRALNYYPFTDKVFRFTPVSMEQLKQTMTSALQVVQPGEGIPEFGSTIYTAFIAGQAYQVKEHLFQSDSGRWLSANEIAVRAASDTGFHYIGKALDQQSLDRAAYYATIGKPVIAVYYNHDGYGKIALVLPGLNAGKETFADDWKMWVPLIADHTIMQAGNFGASRVSEGKMSEGFSALAAAHTTLYFLE